MILSYSITPSAAAPSTKQFDFNLEALTPSDSISLENDTSFSLYGCPGDGSPGNPYRIENLNITTTDTYGIYVTGVGLNFIIQNCYIDAGDYGIYFTGVSDGLGTINNNLITDNAVDGISLWDSLDMTVENNTCQFNGNAGIYTNYADYTVFKNNTCNSNVYGIALYDTYDSDIVDNICTDNTYGIWGDLIWGNNYSGNIITGGNYGFYGTNAQSVTVVNNNFENQINHGLNIRLLENTDIINNTFKGIGIVGMNIEDSRTLSVSNNSITYSFIGIDIANSNESTYTFNRLQHNTEYGISVNPLCDLNVFHHNAFIDNAAILGTPQAIDLSINSTWYEYATQQGNYWDDWGGTGNYSIYGGIYFDLYPLGSSPVIPELDSKLQFWFISLLFFFIPIVTISRKRNKQVS
jgi:parallel beta-helix repeat protein